MSRPGVDPIAAAVAFLAAPGRIERTLARHQPGPDGRCLGCPTTRPVWPCFVAGLAHQARGGTR